MDETGTDHSNRRSPTEQRRPKSLADETELDAFCDEANVALIELYTNGCGICQSMEPVLNNVARALNISVGQINPREDPPLIERFNVQSVPLLLLFVDGKLVSRREDGFVSGDEITAWVHEETDGLL